MDATPTPSAAPAADPLSPSREAEVAELTRLVREFSIERDWEQFHDPKSLILALVGEVGELAELFQWIPAEDAVGRFSAPSRQARAGEEIADVLIYLIRLADVLGLDLAVVTRAKLADSSRRFAVDEVHGRAPEKS